MRKISVFFAAAITLLSLQASAQGVIKFDNEVHDFGNVKEGNVAAHEFRFTNTGNAPIILSQVQASCGCTTPSWTREPVLPGKTGTITASYNSAGRPGAFTKTITITSNATEATKVITIKGIVDAKTEVPKEVSEALKAKSPRLNILSPTTHSFGKIEKGQKMVAKFEVKNTGENDLTIRNVTSNCNCVLQRTSTTNIKKGETATMELTYIPRTPGQAEEVVTIYSNDLHNPEMKVTLKANVVESLVAPSIVKEGGNNVPFR